MTSSKTNTLEQLYNAPDSELSALIRDAIVSFKKQKEYGTECVISYICETNEATIMIAIQKTYEPTSKPPL